MNPVPTLSVIMTVFNGDAFLQETLDGVWAQTFTDFELVVVNNGSTDGTQAILDAVDDARLRVIQAPARGGTFGDGIRLAYAHACGTYIAVQDADDVSLPTRFEKQVAALEANGSLGLVFGAYQDMDADGNVDVVHHPPGEQHDLANALQSHNPLAHSTYMYRKAASDQVGGYAGEYAYGPDFALVVRLMKKGWGVKGLDDVVLKLRCHPGQVSIASDFSVMRAHDALYLFREASGLAGISPQARRAGRHRIAKCAVQYALALLKEGRVREGVKQMLMGLLRYPLYGSAYLVYRLAFQKGRKT